MEQVKDHRQEVLRKLRRVTGHELWERFEQGADRFHASLGELADLLRCRVDAPPRVFEDRLSDISLQATTAGREDIRLFALRCGEEYHRGA
jgi:hypothetical protein